MRSNRVFMDDGHGTFEIMRRTGMSKPMVWRWQERYLDEGVTGLKRDNTRPSRVPLLPRFKLHFTPTSASWLNRVERFFAEITSRRIRRGSYSSVDDLVAAIFGLSRVAQRKAEALLVDQNCRRHPCPCP